MEFIDIFIVYHYNEYNVHLLAPWNKAGNINFARSHCTSAVLHCAQPKCYMPWKIRCHKTSGACIKFP